MVNFLVRLGWSHGDQEFFTRDELVEKFNLEHVGRSAGVFNPEKLLALNAEHIRAASTPSLVPHLTPFLKEKGIAAEDGAYLHAVVDTLKPRSKTFIEMAEGAEFYFVEKPAYDEGAAAKFLTPDLLGAMRDLAGAVAGLADFDEKSLEDAFKRVMEAKALKFGKIAQPVRVALTGKTVSPGIFEMILVLGREKTLARLNDAIAYMEKKGRP
jgi:glutamyl-tRNA synthetase